MQQHEHLDGVRMLVDDDDYDDYDFEEVKDLDVQERRTGGWLKLGVTSRDLVIVRLARLPQRFHLLVEEAFGGRSLVTSGSLCHGDLQSHGGRQDSNLGAQTKLLSC